VPAQPPRPGEPGPTPGRRPDDQPTEFIPRFDELRSSGRPAPGSDRYDDHDRAGDDGYYDDGGDDDYAAPPAEAPRGGRRALHTIGEVFITAGLVVLLFVVYEVYVTNLFAQHKQASATAALNNEWDTVSPGRTTHYNLTDGSGIAKMYIPAFGADYQFTIIEGVSQADLAIGPGHYPGSALPGQPGDFAVAGHRVGEGDPFNDLDLVQSCDAIVVETQTDWFIYRMLPLRSEVAGWADGKGKTPQCSGPDGEAKVQPLGGEYSQTPGQEIVLPSEGDVVAPIPHYPYTTVSTGQEVALMTMTTCNPKFSSTQRLIVHAVLTRDWKKDPSKPNQVPPELKETS
jgi:sortase A